MTKRIITRPDGMDLDSSGPARLLGGASSTIRSGAIN